MVRNAKAKLRRLKKNHGQDLTSEIKLPNLDSFEYRDDLNIQKSKLESFTNRYNTEFQFKTNKHGITMQTKEWNKMKNRRRLVQFRAREQQKKSAKWKVSQKGKAFSTVGQREQHLGEGSVSGVTVPKDLNFETIDRQARLDDIERVDKRRAYPEYYDWAQEQMKMNFMKALEGSFDSHADSLVDKIGRMSPNDFYYLFTTNAEFDFNDWDSKAMNVRGVESQVNLMEEIFDLYDDYLYSDDLREF